MAIKVGDRIPKATLKRLTPEGMKDINTEEYFKGRKVVLFAVPGAFTPTCSAKHLPGYVEQAEKIKAKGVGRDRVRVGERRVRDGLVGQGPATSATRSRMLADGNAEFTQARSGLEIDGSGFGMGLRSPALLGARRGRRRQEAARRGARQVRGQQGRSHPGRPVMKFGIFYEHQLPRPWSEGDEQQLFQEALDQVELADKLGIDYAWEVEHHFLEEYSHSSAPEVFLAACSQRTKKIRLGHGIVLCPPGYNHPARIAERIATLDLVSQRPRRVRHRRVVARSPSSAASACRSPRSATSGARPSSRSPT